MSIRARVALLATILAAGAPVAGQAGRGVIAGRVVDAVTGEPVRAAVVTVDAAARPAGFPGARTTPGFLTDAQGRFIFDNLPAGSFTLHVEKNGFLYGAFGERRPQGPTQPIDLASDGRVLDADIRLWRLSSVSGQVLDGTGEPVVGASVISLRRNFLAGRLVFQLMATETTDDRGVYAFGGLAPGDYVVGATFPISVAAVASLQTNALPSIRRDGLAIRSTAGPFARVVDGRVWALANTYAPSVTALDRATVVSLAAGGDRSGVDVHVKSAPLVTVTGIANGPDGPAAGLTIRLAPSDIRMAQSADALTQMHAVTDADGRFTILATPGQYELGTPTPLGPTVALVPLPLTVGDAGASGIALRAATRHVVSGRLEFEGTSPRPTGVQLRLSLDPADGRGARPALNVAEDGSVRSSAIGAGRYFVRILAGGRAGGPAQAAGWFLKSAMLNGKNVVDEPLEMKDGDLPGLVVTLTDQPSTLSGSVRDGQGAPDSMSTVMVFPVDRAGWADFGVSSRRLSSVRVDRSGAFALRGLPGGEYFVVAVPDELTVDWQSPPWFDAASRLASRIKVTDGGSSSIDLRTVRW